MYFHQGAAGHNERELKAKTKVKGLSMTHWSHAGKREQNNTVAKFTYYYARLKTLKCK